MAPSALAPVLEVVDDDLVVGGAPGEPPPESRLPVRFDFRPCRGFWLSQATKSGSLLPRRWANGHKDCPCRNCQKADVSPRLRVVRDRWWGLVEGDAPPDAIHASFDLPEVLRRYVTEERQGKFKALCVAAFKAACREFGAANVNGDAYFHSAGPGLQRRMVAKGTDDPGKLLPTLLADYAVYKPHVHIFAPIAPGSALARLSPDLKGRALGEAKRGALGHQRDFRRLLTKHYRRRLARFIKVKQDQLPELREVFLKVYAGEKAAAKFLSFVLPEDLRGFPGWPTHTHLSTFGPWRKAARELAAEEQAERPIAVPAAALPYEVLQKAGTFEKLRPEERQVVLDEYTAWEAARIAGGDNGTYAPMARQGADAGQPTARDAQPAFGSNGRSWWLKLNLVGIIATDPTDTGRGSASAVRRYIENEDAKMTRFGLRRLLTRLAELRRDARPEAELAVALVQGDLRAIIKDIDWVTTHAPSRRRAGAFLIDGLEEGLFGDASYFDGSPPFGVCALLTLAELAPLFATLRDVPKVPKRLPLAA